MTTLYCAICEGRFDPDDDHVRVEGEHRRINDRNEIDEYAFHPICWMNLTDGWADPA